MKAQHSISSRPAHPEVAGVVVSRDRIARRLEQIASEIAECYGEGELTILAVLTGSLIFLADLIRLLPLRMRLDVVSVESYPGRATASRGAQLAGPLPDGLAGKDVLIVDDILDSARTLGVLTEAVAKVGPASLRTCVLLRKCRPDLPDRLQPDFVGFDIGREFVVGYGLDFDNLYRNLPDVCVLAPRAGSPSEGGRA